MLNHLLQKQKHIVDEVKAGYAIHADFMKPFH